jgi:hypothetical protein
MILAIPRSSVEVLQCARMNKDLVLAFGITHVDLYITMMDTSEGHCTAGALYTGLR